MTSTHHSIFYCAAAATESEASTAEIQQTAVESTAHLESMSGSETYGDLTMYIYIHAR